MATAPEIVELEQLAKARDIPMSAALRLSGVAPSTYWRWRHADKEPLTTTVRKIRAAIEALSGERAA
jgi:hypothetical protein